MNFIIKTVMAIGYFVALYMVGGVAAAMSGLPFQTALLVGVASGALGVMVAIKRKV